MSDKNNATLEQRVTSLEGQIVGFQNAIARQ